MQRPFIVRFLGKVLLLAGLIALTAPVLKGDYVIKDEINKGERDVDMLPWMDNRTHRKGNAWLTVNNWGWMGNFNDYDVDAYIDAENQDWAPQCEYPGGSGVQYLFAASLWVGALIIDDYGLATPRVSTGADGYVAGEAHEFYPDDESPIEERSVLQGSRNRLGDLVHHEKAISEQDYLAAYTDTLVDPQFTPPVGGVLHEPLGIRIRQKSMSWSYEYASDLIIIEYEVENVASKFLKNLFIGLYVDGDVGRRGYEEKNLDDIAGFITQAYDSARGQWLDVNTAWIADNDGRDIDIDRGNSFTCPHVTGFRVLRSPNPKLETSFNWWTSSQNLDQDFGPSWQSHAISEEGDWTVFRGTPMTDREKYYILSNEEFDYDQWYVNNESYVTGNPQQWLDENGFPYREEVWQNPADSQVDAIDVANGYDTRYLISWGPMGVFDHVDNTGRWIYRLNPGEKFSFSVALVAGKNFHDPNHPQMLDGAIDPDLVNFKSLENAALWASRIYDNEMVDTPIFDFGEDGIPGTSDLGEGDGLLDTGDGWFGEDLGSDGLYGIIPADQDSIAIWYFGHFMGYYSGPDEDGSENNNRLDPGEDALLWQVQNFVADSGFVYAGPLISQGGHSWVNDGNGGRVQRSFGEGGPPDWFIGHLNLNGVLDRGDGIPDFQGPPPPPPPIVHVETEEEAVILRWNDFSERAVDPFSHLRDFEGYRVWVANENQEGAFSLLSEWDRIDYAYFDQEGLIQTPPDTRPWNEAPLDSTVARWSRQAIASNSGLQPIRSPHGSCEPFDDENGDLIYNAPEPYFDENHNEQFDPGEAYEDINFNHHYDEGESFDDENENGVWNAADDYTVYELRIEPVHALFPRYYSVTAFDFGDFLTGTESLESAKTASSVAAAPSGRAGKPVIVVPNPYRMDMNYTRPFMAGSGPEGWSGSGLSWENQDDGSLEFWPQQDRRLDFFNLPEQCLIRIFTVSGDLVQTLPHNLAGDSDRNWQSPYSESWNLNNRNYQMVAPGLYLFSVENKTPGGMGSMQTGKFVIIG